MKTVETFSDLRENLANLKHPMGFVPTMGFLHDGHLSLVHKAKDECESVVVSIFTNPTQFAPDEDLESYPRDIERDLNLLSDIGTDLVWIPRVDAMYLENFQTWVDVEHITKLLEGQFRTSHFRGVTTVVSILFNAVAPQKAYFGQKDAQQALVIKQMVRDLNYPIEIVVCPIIREPDGLAMSSRNIYLNKQERQAALCLSKGLNLARKAFDKDEHTAEELIKMVANQVNQEPLVILEYISCADPESLQELEGEVESCLLSLAVVIGRTRLIDNVVLPESK